MRVMAILLLASCGGPPPAVAPVPPPPITAPCFPDKPAIVATEMWKTLEKYSWSVYLREDEPPPPPTTYGTCKVERNKVTAPDGSLVAELACGVRVLKRGIRDELGLEIGARGQDLLDRKGKALRLVCLANGLDRARCRFDRDDGNDIDATDYVVAGAIGSAPLTGNTARAFFASRTVVELHVNVWCH
jgi:hypothetical protein